MEAHMEAAPSQVSLWWAKLGKWQALTVLATLGAFFVTLGITGDTKAAIVTTFVVFAAASVTIPAFVTFAAATALTVVAITTFAAAAITTIAFAVAFTTFAFAVAFTTFAAIAAAVVVVADKVPGISKKAVWLSCVGEFLLILLPIVWVLRG